MASSFYPPPPEQGSLGFSSRPVLTRRSVDPGHLPGDPSPAGQLHPIVDPPPKTKPAFQFLAFGIILLFGCLQFLPVTHLRDPSDPLRSWIPVDSARNKALSNVVPKNDEESGKVHVVSLIKCLDLRGLAVLINSTLTTSRSPENVYFHFFMPENEDEKMSYYKLKVLFPNSNLDIVGQNEIKEKLLTSIPEGRQHWSLFPELAPFMISSIKFSLRRVVYVSPDTIIKGSIEELILADMGHYAIAAAEDCNRRLGDYVNINIVNAIQRTAAKSWVSKEPYNKNACIPDLNLLLLDGNKLEKHFFEAVHWWNKALYAENERSNSIHPSAVLALYKRYLKLSNTWKLSEANAKVVPFDGPRRLCPENKGRNQRSRVGNIWQQYLSSKSELILGH